ncbi:hypothetical protein [Pararhizobium qamdonense]|uniref:hypothetical protein n=1 Tax=Pararhizobium qamdonense TaxID=3031126 RepID=UPI0023E20574|nr:hypothetical protein [Pararhizobium qamdonense]
MNATDRSAHWRPASPSDIEAIDAIQRIVHADFPEARAVLFERLGLVPGRMFRPGKTRRDLRICAQPPLAPPLATADRYKA